MQCAKPGAEIAASTDPAILAADYARVVRELEEARRQHAATSEILGIISAIGTIHLRRTEVQFFTERQVALLQTFANQAVIAIENTRLFEAERLRTRELTEALDQQTATSEVLQVISSSPGELEPVFQTMLGNAIRICQAKFGNLWLYDGRDFRPVAIHGNKKKGDRELA
jgi:hypothetical protein